MNDDERMAHVKVGVVDWMYAMEMRVGKFRLDMERGRREKVRGGALCKGEYWRMLVSTLRNQGCVPSDAFPKGGCCEGCL